MEKILNQEEIDRLFRAAQGSAPKAEPEKERNVQACDFRHAGQLSKEQVRQVTMLHEAFAPNLANSLGAYLRVVFQSSLVAVEQLPYVDFLERLAEQTYVAAFSVQPVEEIGAVQLDLSVVYPIIDLLLGGPGEALPEPRDLTEIEEQILESVVLIIYRELQNIWQTALPLTFHPGQRFRQGQILSMMPAQERVLNISFEMRVNEVQGNLNFIFPAVVSNLLLRKLQQQGAAQRRRPSVHDATRLRERLLESKLQLVLDVTEVPVRIREISDLRTGDVLVLRRSVQQSASIALNDCAVFKGMPVRCGAVRGGLIQEVLPPPETFGKGRP